MPARSAFDYAVVRVVPRVERDEFINVGVILFCRARRFLGAHIALDRTKLAALASDLDASMIERHLASISSVCAGGTAGGPIGELPLAERYHWLVAPRSTIIQTSPAHPGLCTDPQAMLDHLAQLLVASPRREG